MKYFDYLSCRKLKIIRKKIMVKCDFYLVLYLLIVILKVTCEACGITLDKYFLENHKKEECPKRIVESCPYCTLDLTAESAEG